MSKIRAAVPLPLLRKDFTIDAYQVDEARVAGADLIGINNRDLRSFETDLGVTLRLAPRVPPGILVVAESRIANPEDVRRLERAGAHAFLIGESLMRQDDLALALRALRSRA